MVNGSLRQTLRFPGQRNDSETSLFQNWHRDYDASLGRYVQSDPIGLAGGINTYGYVGGNPLRYMDPEGLLEQPLGGFSIQDSIQSALAPKPSLVFNGSELIAYDSVGNEINRWPAVSGKAPPDSCQCASDQNLKNTGPIPEGEWSVDPRKINKRQWYHKRWGPGLLDRRWGPASAWGNVRTQIDPKPGTQTFNRDGFNIHGGRYPGSAGCIDLTKANDDFHEWFNKQKGALDLRVEYE